MKTSQALVRTTIRTELGPSEAKNQAPVRQRVSREDRIKSKRRPESGHSDKDSQATERTRVKAYRGPGSGCRKDQSQAVERPGAEPNEKRISA